MGRLTALLIIPLYAVMVTIGVGAFITSHTQAMPDGTPAPYPSNQTLNSSFFTNTQNFISDINKLGSAVARIAPSSSSQLVVVDLAAFVDTSVAFFHVFADIPFLIGTFFYDLARMLFTFLPVQPSPAVIAVIDILFLIPIVYVIMEIVGAIRSPSYTKW